VLRAAVAPLVHGLWRTRVDPAQIEGVRGPCFLYGNHSNNLDAFIFNMFKPWGDASSGVLTAEYMRGGPVTAALRGIGILATRKRVAEPHLVGRIMRLLDAGRMVFIYPEGGRRWDGRPRPWIESTAKLFARVGVPVYPVLTHGSYVAWPRWARFPRPARIRIDVLPPVPLDRSLDAASAVARLATPIAMDENEPPEDTRPRRAFRPADGFERLLYRDPDTGLHGGLFTPDGHRIANAAGSIRWRMLPDSRILDERTGAVMLTGDLYDAIRALPLAPAPGGSLLANTVEFHSGPPYRHAVSHGRARILMHSDHLDIHSSSGIENIPAEEITACEVERNFKLEIGHGEQVLRFDFVHGGSALQWYDILVGRSALGAYAPHSA
jgi:1-acyl-sn-glycerol-3-phosphate acyltransferase